MPGKCLQCLYLLGANVGAMFENSIGLREFDNHYQWELFNIVRANITQEF